MKLRTPSARWTRCSRWKEKDFAWSSAATRPPMPSNAWHAACSDRGGLGGGCGRRRVRPGVGIGVPLLRSGVEQDAGPFRRPLERGEMTGVHQQRRVRVGQKALHAFAVGWCGPVAFAVGEDDGHLNERVAVSGGDEAAQVAEYGVGDVRVSLSSPYPAQLGQEVLGQVSLV